MMYGISVWLFVSVFANLTLLANTVQVPSLILQLPNDGAPSGVAVDPKTGEVYVCTHSFDPFSFAILF